MRTLKGQSHDGGKAQTGYIIMIEANKQLRGAVLHKGAFSRGGAVCGWLWHDHAHSAHEMINRRAAWHEPATNCQDRFGR